MEELFLFIPVSQNPIAHLHKINDFDVGDKELETISVLIKLFS